MNGPQHIFGLHSVLYQDYGVPSPRLGTTRSPTRRCGSRSSAPRATTSGSTAVPSLRRCPTIEDGTTIRDAIAASIHTYQSTFGVDTAGYDTAALLRLSQYNLFRNSSVLVWGDELNVLLALPGRTPDTAELDCVRAAPASPDKPRRRPA